MYLNNFYNFIIPLAVPFFFLSTGFFIGKKVDNIENMNQSDFEIIKGVLLKAIKLYIIFTIIYLPITFYYFNDRDYSMIKSIIIFIRNILFIGENFNSWILWYLLSEIYGLLLMYLLKRKVKNNKVFIYIGTVLFLIGIFINYFNEYNFQLNIITLLQKVLKNIIPNGRIFYSTLFIPLGIYISKNEKIKNVKLSSMLLIMLFILNTFVNVMMIIKVSLVICSFIIFKFVINIDFKKKEISNYCKQASEDFYFWHLYVWSIIMYVTEGTISQSYGMEYYLLTTTILLLFTTIHYILKKIYLKKENYIKE